MHFGPTSTPPKIVIDGQELETVNEFVYLGSQMSSKPSADAEVARRKRSAMAQMSRLSRLWRDQGVDINVKVRAYLSYVRPVLLYAIHAAPLTKTQNDEFDRFERRCWRWITGARYDSEYWPTNTQLISRIRGTRAGIKLQPPSEVIRRARLKWLGHSLRSSIHAIARRALFATTLPRRNKGYISKSWTDVVLAETSSWHGAKITRSKTREQLDALHALATDRKTWRDKVNNDGVSRPQ